MTAFASNPNFIAPVVAPYLGQPTKVAMTEAQRANGIVPGQPVAAEHINHELNAITADIEELQAEDASDLAYTPAVGANWPDPDPTQVAAALDQLASRTALGIPYTPANASHWTDPDPTTVAAAIDTLKVEVNQNTSDIASLQAEDASDLAYTPADGADWQGTDPDDVAEALDKLAALGGRFLGYTEYTTSGSGTHTYHPECNYRIVDLQAGGGGGGGVAGATSALRVAPGGQAGGWNRIAGVPGNGAYTVGAAGVAGSGSTPADAGAGGDSSFEGTSATGGAGGQTVSSGGTTAEITHVNLNSQAGATGHPAMNLAGASGPAMSGEGGGSRYGVGGRANFGTTTQSGFSPITAAYGAAGGGALVHNSTNTRSGGAGRSGRIGVWEFKIPD